MREAGEFEAAKGVRSGVCGKGDAFPWIHSRLLLALLKRSTNERSPT